jgi:N6-adenosine-specific RNA methylase IME4
VAKPLPPADLEPLPAGPWDVILADPPWDYRGREQFGFAGDVGVSSGGAIKQYPTMSTAQICAIAVRDAAAGDALLFIWTTGPMILVDTPKVIEAWGFEPATVAFVWDKRKTNPGYYTLSQCEFCIVCKRGRIPRPRGSRNERQFISMLRGAHSAKPDEVRNRISRMFPKQRKLEMFARNRKQDWTSWGNEVDGSTTTPSELKQCSFEELK